MSFKTASILIFLLLSSTANAADESDYFKFFEKYQTLGDSFDTSVVNLYADDAEITSIRKMPDGIEQLMKIEGRKWKEMIVDTMDIGKQRGDTSRFTDIKIAIDSDRAKISANRYATIKCFDDKNYYMVVEERANNELRIVEEFYETPIQSKCISTPKNDLSLLLKATVKVVNKQLPVMIDGETKLEKTSSEDKTLIYHYVLINYLSTEVNEDAIDQNIRASIIENICTKPSLKPVVDKGGTISFRYSGKDKKHIFSIDVDKSSCS